MKRNEHLIFIAVFTALVLFVFRDVLFLRAGLLGGDYLQQFYPWCSLYSAAIKAGHLALWSGGVQCGYPVFAEGQIGELYPLNLLFFGLLPLKAAYNYSFLFHFVLGGVLTYFFARSKGACMAGGAFSALLISFGSLYGGLFVNTSALKALSLFPLSLILFDLYIDKKDIRFIFASGIVVALQLLAGAFQMAVYAAVFSLLYFAVMSFAAKEGFKRTARNIGAVLFTGILIAIPQLAETFVLSGYSNRASWTPDFAFWNSFSPAAFAGSVFPYLGRYFSHGNILYLGVTALFFAAFYLVYADKKRAWYALVTMTAFSVFFALGGYNPVYAFLVKVSGFYSLRAPSRLIYFAAFAVSVAAGLGFTMFWKIKKAVPAAFYDRAAAFVALAVVCFLAAKTAISVFGEKILVWAKASAASGVYGKALHRHSMEFYMAKTEALYKGVKGALSFSDPIALTSFVMVLSAAGVILAMKTVKGGKRVKALKTFVFCFAAAELFSFSLFSRGVRPEIKGWDSIEPAGNVYSAMAAVAGYQRVCPFGEFGKMPAWLKPSMNSVYGIKSAALYTPLINSDYFAMMKGITIVDDSVGIFPCEKEALYASFDLLRRLSVGYVVSTEELDDPVLEKIVSDEGLFLYKLSGAIPRLAFVAGGGPYVPDAAEIAVAAEKDGFIEALIDAPSAGRIVFAEKYYPGWEAYVDGTPAAIRGTDDLMQYIDIAPGKHRVVFMYKPVYLNAFLPLSAIVFAGSLLYCLFGGKAGKRRKDGR